MLFALTITFLLFLTTILFLWKSSKLVPLHDNTAIVFDKRISSYDKKCLRDGVKTRIDQLSLIDLKPTHPELVLWGDSVVYRMLPPALLGYKGLVNIGLPGQTIDCAINEISVIKAIKPKELILYFGANEADKGLTNDEEFERFYNEIIGSLLDAGISPHLHEVHFLSSRIRSQKAVTRANEIIKNLALRHNLKLLISPNELRFQNISEENKYSYDGEMLKPIGYQVWLEKIKIQLGTPREPGVETQETTEQ